MLARLGNVLYWLGCILAAVLITGGIALWIGEGQSSPNGYYILSGFAVVALVVWLIGRACRYVLSGT